MFLFVFRSDLCTCSTYQAEKSKILPLGPFIIEFNQFFVFEIPMIIMMYSMRKFCKQITARSCHQAYERKRECLLGNKCSDSTSIFSNYVIYCCTFCSFTHFVLFLSSFTEVGLEVDPQSVSSINHHCCS